MIEMKTYKTREEWLEARKGTLGGSDAGCALGFNPWKSNVELFDEMTGRLPVEESGNAATEYGHKAEPLLRELFRLDYPKYEVSYAENNMWINSDYPFAHASLDGWLRDEAGRLGILEIKTSTIQNAAGWEKWENAIPMHYYAQILFYMAVINADFAVLKAKLMIRRGDDVSAVIRHYKIERKEVEKDIEFVMLATEGFYNAVKEDRRPARILPQL